MRSECIALFFSLLGVAACGSSVDDGKSTGDIQEVTSCGGLAGKSCPAGKACVDDPADECDPANGGADCPGICVQATDQCSGLDVCACQATPGCQASFDSCHCPSDYGCEPEIECFCGGGAFLGCSSAN
jgi:hypothetical protein